MRGLVRGRAFLAACKLLSGQFSWPDRCFEGVRGRKARGARRGSVKGLAEAGLPRALFGACKLLPWCPRGHPGGLKTARGLAHTTHAEDNLRRPQCVIRGALEHTTRGLAHTTRAENNTDPLRAISVGLKMP